MALKRWVPRGFVLKDKSKIGKLIVSDRWWQLYITNSCGYALVVLPILHEKWMQLEYIFEGMFQEIIIGVNTYYINACQPEYMISSTKYGPFPKTNIEAKAFAIALRETRKIILTEPLNDAIYFESYSKILPTFSVDEHTDDKTVLGTWLSGGVAISTDSYRRLSKLSDWMDNNELEKIILDAGIEVNKTSFTEKNKDNDISNKEKKNSFEDKSNEEKAESRFLLPGRPYLEDFFNEHIIDIIRNQEKYKKVGIDFPSAIVLHGPPGCGKTYAVERLIEYLDWPMYAIDSGSIGSPYIHETSKKVASIFEKAINDSPSVIVIDEMEAFLVDRGLDSTSGTHHVEEVAEFLRRIPEATKNNVLVFAMTNMIDSIDKAILRRGRFDHIIEVNMPSKEEVLSLLKSKLDKLPLVENINIEAIAEKLVGRPFSDAAFVLKEAGRITVKNDKELIDEESINLAIKLLPASIKEVRKIGFN